MYEKIAIAIRLVLSVRYIIGVIWAVSNVSSGRPCLSLIQENVDPWI